MNKFKRKLGFLSILLVVILSIQGIPEINNNLIPKVAATIPFPSGTINGHYNLAKNSTIVHCGISYCKGENCNPDKELRTTNTSVFINFTKGFCTSPTGVCVLPHTSTDLSISAQSPSMEPRVPYVYKFYLVGSLGKYEEWFFGLEYKAQ